MVDANDDAPLESRPPTLADLVALCRELNRQGARYVVVGGMAIVQAGFVRATEDVDLLVDASPENVKRVKQALMTLPDQAVSEVDDGDVERHVVVRVADEIVVDLMRAACGIDYEEAAGFIERVWIEGVEIPFPKLELLWRMKETVREKDRLDRMFLARLLNRDS